ncbi:MAG TPA: TIGR03435 family protein [Bryobacteraceae bacterium]|nr:TIGR03435 family protein [Bryobacteraceae bacterium]
MTHRLERLLPCAGKPWLVAAVWAAIASAQPQPPVRPQFTAVSVKPCPNPPPGAEGRTTVSPAAVRLECWTVDRLIRMAYLSFPDGLPVPVSATTGLPMPTVSLRQHDAPIAGSPPWIQSERFTIEAQSATPASREMLLGPMLQAVLEDRFQLKIHRQTRDVPVYAITVASGGPHLTAAQKGSCIVLDLSIPAPPPAPGRPPPVLCGMFRPSANGGLDVRGITMADLCSQLSVWLDRDVIDKTGIAGTFDLHLDLRLSDLGGARDASPGSPPPATRPNPLVPITAALKKLGLQLEPAQAPAEFLVIDRVVRP